MSSADLWQLYRIAQLYYREGKTQEEISAAISLSRSQISRLLDKARDMGIVRIEVALPEELETGPLTDFLRQNMGLDNLILVPVEDDWDSHKITDAIARTGAFYLPRLIRGSQVIGIGWGETMYRTAQALKTRPLGGEPVFIPMIGASGSNNPYLQINAIIDRISERLQGDSFFANLPAFREKNVPLTAYENKRLSMLHDYWDHVEAAVFGLGTKESCQGAFDEEVSLASQERIMSSDVVGDVLSQFFFADGSILEQDESFHTNAFPAERLKGLRKTICLAGGPRKVRALIGAARAGYYKNLITDTRTAALIYEHLRSDITI